MVDSVEAVMVQDGEVPDQDGVVGEATAQDGEATVQDGEAFVPEEVSVVRSVLFYICYFYFSRSQLQFSDF
ncbi:unnamed protein product [Heligmosomoides polygyrus]|uniref:Uncharacterized protein n=1 Tax=Heligmosomoides polygyrus TaxID=6339 RepID=A0A3P7Y6W7_HELPZ|nr:unnamed protein product [Heligmosomoides polygyrus]